MTTTMTTTKITRNGEVFARRGGVWYFLGEVHCQPGCWLACPPQRESLQAQTRREAVEHLITGWAG